MNKELEIKKRKWEVYAKNCISFFDCYIDLENKNLKFIDDYKDIIYSLNFKNWIHKDSILDKAFINLLLIKYPKCNIKYITDDISILLQELDEIFS